MLVVFTVVIGGGMFYFIVQPNTMVHREAECVAAGAALPLVNTTTGMGMTAAIAGCE